MSTSSSALPTDISSNNGSSLDGPAFLPPSDGGTIWDGAGGPALVVVFIAVGLLAVLLGILLIVRGRRLTFGDDDDDEDEEETYGPIFMNRLRKRPKLGPKPKIFDLPIAYGPDGKGDVAKWTGIVVRHSLASRRDIR